MINPDADEAAGIVTRMLGHMAQCIDPTTSAAPQARSQIGYVVANINSLLLDDVIGSAIDYCFQLVIAAGATQSEIEFVRQWLIVETPKTLGGTQVQAGCVQLCLAAEGQIIANITFVSREDVETCLQSILEPFAVSEELAADNMDQMAFQALISLQATITNFLVNTARPLPYMTSYQFNKSLPSLVIAYRLYGDASRADQIVQENKIVHPAFCPPSGTALSA